jgi:hypothetical protein
MMTIVLNWGLGVDSTSILDRWLNEPHARDFDLSELIVLTAQTGSEFPDTRECVEKHILPQLREKKVRYVQVARAGNLKGDGHVVLSDTTEPDRLHTEGAFKLLDELLAAGTVPAVQNRRCSTKAKGRPNDAWLKDHIRGPYRQVMGFNADEQKRVDRDSCYGGDNRNAEYPLMAWGWGRERCERYLFERFGIRWPKSACSFCPFSRGKPEVLERFARHPEAAAEALYLEHVSLALNPLMTLYAGGSLRSKLDPAVHAAALRLFEERLSEAKWGLYQVRRVYKKKGSADRCVDLHQTGTRGQMDLALEIGARHLGGYPVVEEAGSKRFYTMRRRPDVYPSAEEMWVAAPADAREKSAKGFGKAWVRFHLPVVA